MAINLPPVGPDRNRFPKPEVLDQLVGRTCDLLRERIRTISKTLAKDTREESGVDAGPDDFSPDAMLPQPPQRDLLPHQAEIQARADRCTRWLTSQERRNVPVFDPVFQKISWLCGVAQDLLPEFMAVEQDSLQYLEAHPNESKRALRVQRLERVQDLYQDIHQAVALLFHSRL